MQVGAEEGGERLGLCTSSSAIAPWGATGDAGASSQPSTATSRCRALGLVSLHILHQGVPSISSWLKHKGDARGWVLQARSSSLRVERGSPSFGITRYQGSHCWFLRPRLFLPELQEGLFAAVNVHKSCLDENIGLVLCTQCPAALIPMVLPTRTHSG